MTRTPISTGSEWTFELIREYDQEIGRFAHDIYGACVRDRD